MRLPIYQVDAFTSDVFAGNPAAVCPLEQWLDERLMLAIAAENNLSETAFFVPAPGGDPERRVAADGQDRDYDIRWFTPVAEVDLCGHATLASAHLLFEDGHVSKAGTINFRTRSGKLTASYDKGWIYLDFPATPYTRVDLPQLLKSVRGKERMSGVSAERWILAEFETEQEVKSYQPDFAAIAALPGGHLLITARSTMPGVDFVSRCFAPGAGINEDPVTGSAHTALGPYWMGKLGKSEFLAYQASARGGYIRVRVAGDRVILGGQAVTVMRGEMA